jgi:hypothetical protein
VVLLGVGLVIAVMSLWLGIELAGSVLALPGIALGLNGALDPSSRAALSSPGAGSGHLRYGPACRADVAQLVEQRFCKPQVPGSSPVVGSIANVRCRVHHETAVSARCRFHSG